MAVILSAIILSTVSHTISAPIHISLSCITPTLSLSAIGILRRCMTLPVSISCVRKNVVIPVSLSPFIIAQLSGAAPLYCGRSEACRLNVPIGGISHTICGNILNATTICKSALYERSSSIKASSLSFSGCNMGRPTDKAYCLTGEYCILCPRPAGLSGIVTTATTLYCRSTSKRRVSTAKSGVPIYTIRKSCFVIFLPYY